MSANVHPRSTMAFPRRLAGHGRHLTFPRPPDREEIGPAPRHLLPADASPTSWWPAGGQQDDPGPLTCPSIHDLAVPGAAEGHTSRAPVDPELLLPLVDVMLAVAHERATRAIAQASASDHRLAVAGPRAAPSGALRPPRTAAEIWHDATDDLGCRSSAEDLLTAVGSDPQHGADGFDGFWSDISDDLPVRQRLRLWVRRQQASSHQPAGQTGVAASTASGADMSVRMGAFVAAVQQELALVDAQSSSLVAAAHHPVDRRPARPPAT
ncbi:MAG: hypothetical protein ACSLFP_06920, partial [Acidimicrobiales bacterium]